MSQDPVKRLLIEAHRAIEQESARAVAAALSRGKVELSYPPNGGLTDDQSRSLRGIAPNADLESALHRIVADAAAGVLFQVFALLDGVAEPEATRGEWAPIHLKVAPEDADDPTYGMIHDALMESYWDWRKLRPSADGQLDNLRQPAV